MDSKFLTTKDIETILNVPKTTLYAWVSSGRFPKPLRLTRKTLRWDSQAVASWLKAKQER